MSQLLVIIMKSESTAKAVAQSLDVTLGDRVETLYMTYANSRLSRGILLRTDLFLLDVFNEDALGLRAEGIFAAERFAASGHRVLLITANSLADKIDSPFYWDMASSDFLPERVISVLAQPIPRLDDFVKLRQIFASYCRKPHDGHRH